MRREHVVTAVDGRSPNVAGRAFLVWFRRHYDPGDAVTFTVVDQAGQSQKIRCTLPAQGE
jgi:hypothetical protein